jgi:peptidoglycan/LPS O-acetylase OafA/YrhL
MTEEKRYYPQLDSIRGISVLSVFFYHAYKPVKTGFFLQDVLCFFFSKMGLGLDVFFILSSFLITFLGIKEYKKNGYFSFRKYFIRRILRIWPLYFIFMFLSFVVIPLLAKHYGYNLSLPPFGWYLFFVSNFYLEDHVFFLRLLWTLSIEEQFYIVWGICLFFFQKKIRLIVFFFGILSIIFNLYAAINNASIYFNTLTYLIDMMSGAYAAYSILKNNFLIRFVKLITGIKSICFYSFLPFLIIIYYFGDRFFDGVDNNLFALFIKLIFIGYCTLLILDQMANDMRLLNLGKYRFLAYTGKISYGLYCFHGVIITFWTLVIAKLSFYVSPLIGSFLILFITFFVAHLSYQFIEKPFLNLKNKFV